MSGLSLGLGLSARTGGSLSRYAIVEGGVSYLPLFVWDASTQQATNAPLQTVFANTRNGGATFEQADGTITTQTALNTRTNHFIDGVPGALFEPSRINSIRNSTMQGAVDGLLSAGGSLPTNWSVVNMAASAVTVATGTENGVPYIDLTLNGTPTANVQIFTETNTAIPAAEGQSWTHAARLQIIDGDLTNIANFNIANNRMVSSGTFHSAAQRSITPTTVAEKFSFTDTSLDDSDGIGTIAYIRPRMQQSWSSGAINITLRIYADQKEQGAFATTFIPTSGTAVTRLADRASVALSDIGFDAGGGSIFIEGRAYYATGGSGFPRIFQVDDGTASNRITLDIDESAGTMRLVVVSGGVSQASETMAYTSGAAFKAGFTYDAGRCVLSLNGSDSTADTSVTLPAGLTTLNWASDHAGANNGAAVHISKFATYSKEFADATLNAETA